MDVAVAAWTQVNREELLQLVCGLDREREEKRVTKIRQIRRGAETYTYAQAHQHTYTDTPRRGESERASENRSVRKGR